MLVLSKIKKEKYRKKLKKKFTQSTDDEIDLIIDYLFNLAILESEILHANEK